MWHSFAAFCEIVKSVSDLFSASNQLIIYSSFRVSWLFELVFISHIHAGVGTTDSALDADGVLEIDTTISLETTWHAMEDLVSMGLVRSIGIRYVGFLNQCEPSIRSSKFSIKFIIVTL